MSSDPSYSVRHAIPNLDHKLLPAARDPTRPLIIVCDWLPPAYGAVGQYALAQAQEAACNGRPTTVIGLGLDARNREELLGPHAASNASLKIIRLSAQPARKSNLLLRGSWAVQTSFRLMSRTIRELRAGDNAEIKVTGSPPFFAYLMIVANILFLRRTLTYRITDFYPETALAAGRAGFLKPTLPLFHWLRRRANTLEVLSGCQGHRLAEAGIPTDRVKIVRDGSPIDMRAPSKAPPRPFPADKIILLYSGNLGVAHDIATFAEAYLRHVRHGGDRVRLWLNATGAKVEELASFCRKNDLPIYVTPPVPLEDLPGVLSVASVHLVTLGRPFWGYVIPSKIYACVESGKPILYVGPEESDIHLLVSDVTGSASVRNGDVDACLKALDSF